MVAPPACCRRRTVARVFALLVSLPLAASMGDWLRIVATARCIGDASENSVRRSLRDFVLRLNGGEDRATSPTKISALIAEHQDNEEAVGDVYSFGAALGAGGFGKVWKGVHRITGKRVAVKTIDLCKIPADKLDELKNEVAIMKMLDHPSIVRLYETFMDAENHQLHLVMEMCEGGDLLDFLLKVEIDENDGQKTWRDGGSSHVVTEGHISQLAAKMMSALQYLHSCGIAHRDIKPENFLLEAPAGDLEGSPFAGGEIKMIDFGFSKRFYGTGKMHEMCGSPYYVAPEILECRSKDEHGELKGYGPACDVWSMGVVFYMMLVGQPPFEGEGDDYTDSTEAMYKAIALGEYEWPAAVRVSDEAKDFVASLLVRDPAQRASAAQAMEHPWLSRPRQMPQPALRDAGPGAQREREREREEGRRGRRTLRC
eukprot:Tamp_10064.p1 GENE.Tamp_10064~~Tamp_10064.p1  ORF type:complete len:428 (+),score=89.58 Tamp_10064:2-1285(+)